MIKELAVKIALTGGICFFAFEFSYFIGNHYFGVEVTDRQVWYEACMQRALWLTVAGVIGYIWAPEKKHGSRD